MFEVIARRVFLFALAVPLSVLAKVDAPSGDAPRGNSGQGTWSSGNKEFFGTSYESYDDRLRYSDKSSTSPISRVWFTGAEGIVTEVFWPQLDRKQVKDSQFLVTDGKTFLFEEKGQSNRSVVWLENGVPAYVVTIQDSQQRFVIEKTIWSDPDSDVVLQRVKFVRKVPGLRMFVLHNAAVANTKLRDTARASVGEASWEPGLYFWEDRQAHALVTSVPFRRASVGFEGTSDGFGDLNNNFIMDQSYQMARKGNVVGTAWLDLPEDVGESEFTWALGFAYDPNAAGKLARSSLNRWKRSLEKYRTHWREYQKQVRDLAAASGDKGKLYRASVAMIKSMEDKSSGSSDVPGGFVASPSVPWGQHRVDTVSRSIEDQPPNRKDEVGGYHLVWPRDLYQMATTFLAIGDPKSAQASLEYFKKIQFGPKDGNWEFGWRRTPKDGSFPQNTWIDGRSYWTSLQMDQVAFPVILTYRLWFEGHVALRDYWDMSRRAADFIVRFGPWSAQERWEENMGVSPSTVAAQIAALWTAAQMAKALGDHERASLYLKTGDAWHSKPGDNVEAWTFTSTGVHGNGKYYQRVEAASSPDQLWNPNDDSRFWISNGGKHLPERDVVDGGFLELVRLGVREADNDFIRSTISVYDAVIGRKTPMGWGFFRYLGDRYNYDDQDGQQTDGMLWPFLTGERGHFEVELARLEGRARPGDAAVSWISTMEAFATPSLMLPEQVWDRGERVGKPTGSATPLGWTHGEYIKLLRTRELGIPSDRIPLVADRTKLLHNKVWPQVQETFQLFDEGNR